jgi:UDP-glucose 4-epimerase
VVPQSRVVRVKVLVTGGAGFIGSHVADALIGAGHAVAIVDDLSTGNRAWLPPQAAFHAVDIRAGNLGDVFAAERPDAVVHLAAQASVGRSVTDPAFDASVNIGGGVNLLDCCRRFGVRRMIYSSSGGAGYGDTDLIPTSEEHPTRPASPYGISKIAMEQYVDAWGPLWGMSGISLRYANVYGPRQNPHGEAGVVAIFCSRLLAGQPLVINGDGRQTRDFVHVSDVAAANLLALEHPDVAGQVNIGTGVETSVNDICDALRKAAGSGVEAVHAPERPGEQRRSCLSPKRAERVLGWRPTVLLGDGLAQTLEHFRKESGR